MNIILHFCESYVASQRLKNNKNKVVIEKATQARRTLYNIMSAITDWAAAEEVELAGIKSVLDAIVNGIVALDNAIIAFQKSPGPLTPDDQAAIDRIQNSIKALRTKAESIDTSMPTPNTPGLVEGHPVEGGNVPPPPPAPPTP